MIDGKERIYCWEDTAYEYSGSTLYFRVKKDGDTVYEGYSEAFPDGTPIRVYINRIARDYMENGRFSPVRTGVTQDAEAYAEFSLVRLDGDVEDAVLGTIQVLYGFYGDAPAESTEIMSDPINGHADMRMYLPVTLFNEEATEIEIVGYGI